jgi:hypothetical protein
MRFIISLSLMILSTVSCSKKSSTPENLSVKVVKTFESKQQAFSAIATFLSKEAPSEKLLAIDNISYIHTLTSTIALVFYETNTGKHNLVYTMSVGDSEIPGDGTITVCEGDECACRVRATIDNEGNVKVGCSCSSCEMVTTEL